MLEGVGLVMSQTGTDPRSISDFITVITLFTNALIERKGARTALITTKGFRDAIEIAREHRYDMYDLYMQRPQPRPVVICALSFLSESWRMEAFAPRWMKPRCDCWPVGCGISR